MKKKINEINSKSSGTADSEVPFEALLDDSSSDDESTPEARVDDPQKESEAATSATQPSSQCQRRPCGSDEGSDEIILSLIWLKGHVGAGYYNIATSELFVMDDVIEDDFNYCITRTLYRQCQPRYVLMSSGSPEAFTNVIKKLIVKDATDASVSSSSRVDQASQIAVKILPKSANGFDDCVHRVNCLKLGSEPPDTNNAGRVTFLNSVLNFDSKSMIHALGMLLKYIDANWGKLALDPNGEPDFLYINHVKLRDIVMIEEDTYRELNIMQTKFHPSLFKFGTSVRHEGMNLFTLLNRCQSRVGVQHLWKLMQQPTRDIKVLEERFHVTEFFLQPDNRNVFESLRSSLRQVQRLTPTMLNRYATPLAKPADWKKLSSTLSNIIHIGELCDTCRDSARIFSKVADSVTQHMHSTRYFIDYVVDHEMSKHFGKFVVRLGVDAELDELNRIRKSLPAILSDYGDKEKDQLPDAVETSLLIYIPELGFLLSITEWAGEPPEDVELPGLVFKCQINGIRHYKSPMAIELDETLGDVARKITRRQSEILMRLINFISEDIVSIAKCTECCAELDALMSLAMVAQDHNYVKPTMVKCQVIDIKDGRHPLRELFSQYVPNDIRSGDRKSLIKIFSGPNACGKTVYMKQVALIIYMAHIGCYVPASSARIGVVTNILTQIPSIESTCSNTSSFLVDLRKINTILYSSTPNSLIIVDEFGRGTSEVDGLALLASVLQSFINRGNYCPHIFVATHMHRIGTLLPSSPIFELQKFDYVLNDENNLVFLYKIISGSVGQSFAHEVAKSAGLDSSVLEEASEVFEYMKRGQVPPTKPNEDGRRAIKHLINVSKKENFNSTDVKDLIKKSIVKESQPK